MNNDEGRCWDKGLGWRQTCSALLQALFLITVLVVGRLPNSLSGLITKQLIIRSRLLDLFTVLGKSLKKQSASERRYFVIIIFLSLGGLCARATLLNFADLQAVADLTLGEISGQ